MLCRVVRITQVKEQISALSVFKVHYFFIWTVCWGTDNTNWWKPGHCSEGQEGGGEHKWEQKEQRERERDRERESVCVCARLHVSVLGCYAAIRKPFLYLVKDKILNTTWNCYLKLPKWLWFYEWLIYKVKVHSNSDLFQILYHGIMY